MDKSILIILMEMANGIGHAIDTMLQIAENKGGTEGESE